MSGTDVQTRPHVSLCHQCLLSATLFYLLYFYMQTADRSRRNESEVLNAEQRQ